MVLADSLRGCNNSAYVRFGARRNQTRSEPLFACVCRKRCLIGTLCLVFSLVSVPFFVPCQHVTFFQLFIEMSLMFYVQTCHQMYVLNERIALVRVSKFVSASRPRWPELLYLHAFA